MHGNSRVHAFTPLLTVSPLLILALVDNILRLEGGRVWMLPLPGFVLWQLRLILLAWCGAVTYEISVSLVSKMTLVAGSILRIAAWLPLGVMILILLLRPPFLSLWQPELYLLIYPALLITVAIMKAPPRKDQGGVWMWVFLLLLAGLLALYGPLSYFTDHHNSLFLGLALFSIAMLFSILRALSVLPGMEKESRPIMPITLNPALLDNFKISSREAEVAVLVASGLTNTEIGERLFISLSTVKTHLVSLMGKTSSRNRVELLAKLTNPTFGR